MGAWESELQNLCLLSSLEDCGRRRFRDEASHALATAEKSIPHKHNNHTTQSETESPAHTRSAASALSSSARCAAAARSLSQAGSSQLHSHAQRPHRDRETQSAVSALAKADSLSQAPHPQSATGRRIAQCRPRRTTMFQPHTMHLRRLGEIKCLRPKLSAEQAAVLPAPLSSN